MSTYFIVLANNTYNMHENHGTLIRLHLPLCLVRLQFQLPWKILRDQLFLCDEAYPQYTQSPVSMECVPPDFPELREACLLRL